MFEKELMLEDTHRIVIIIIIPNKNKEKKRCNSLHANIQMPCINGMHKKHDVSNAVSDIVQKWLLSHFKFGRRKKEKYCCVFPS